MQMVEKLGLMFLAHIRYGFQLYDYAVITNKIRFVNLF